MNRLLIFAAISFGILSTAQAQDEIDGADAQEEIKLPESEQTAVFTMGFSGGGPAVPVAGGKARPPFLQVFADGRVVSAPQHNGAKTTEFKMNEKQLQTFLKQLVNEYDFYNLSNEEISDEIEYFGEQVMVADASTVELKMELDRGAHSLSVYAPRFAAQQMPAIESLQYVAKIEKLGRQLGMITEAGGYDNVENALTMANDALKEKGFDPMTLDDLYACKVEGETVTINFNKKFYKPNGRWRDWINAKYIDNGDEATVEVKSNIKKKTPKKPESKSAEA